MPTPDLSGLDELGIQSPMRVLVLDIETAPANVYVWRFYDTTVGINQVIEPGYVMCWGARWLGEGKALFASLHHDGRDEMVRRMHALISEADAIVTYNGKRFDLRHLRREFVLAGLAPPSPHHDIDLLPVVRQQFAFESDKLEYVASRRGIGHKIKHRGFDLWTECMAGDDKAWAEMKRYCNQDVKLTEVLYVRLLPWIKGHPHVGLVTDEHKSLCGRCGSVDLQRVGYETTKLRRYERYLCLACGGWSRGQHQNRGVNIRPV